MERTMTTSLDVTTVRPRRMLGWVIGGAATVAAIGLLVAQSPFDVPTKANAGTNTSETFATIEPVTLRFVPSPVIETNPEFFFGTGDGSGGYYAERPKHREALIEW
jgi:hypothetical protein